MRRRYTPADLVCEVLSAALVFAAFCVPALRWHELPAQLPAHFDAAGQINRWADKRSLWALPGILLALWALLTIVGCFPSLWNTGVPVTEQNRERVYRLLGSLLSIEKLALCAVFFVLLLRTLTARPLPGWFLPVSLAAVFAPLTVCLARIFRAR